jgi:DnaK suppressor protein
VLTTEQLRQVKDVLVKQKIEMTEVIPVDELKSEHLADDTDIAAMDTAQTLSTKLVNRKLLYSKKIDEALAKIVAGTYGECGVCGEIIAFKRLLARPTATLCVDCKSDQEKEEIRRRNPNSTPISDWEPE